MTGLTWERVWVKGRGEGGLASATAAAAAALVRSYYYFMVASSYAYYNHKYAPASGQPTANPQSRCLGPSSSSSNNKAKHVNNILCLF